MFIKLIVNNNHPQEMLSIDIYINTVGVTVESVLREHFIFDRRLRLLFDFLSIH